ncbi:MAG: trimethylamine methyltransferase family protein [Desulfohalobiaceae bacterium]|nr:trimethylamine methyltransferase family protein [Desulfohalobiaceae bacterium]
MKEDERRLRGSPLTYLTGEQLRVIHQASLRILEETGSVVRHQEARDLLQKAGARVMDDSRVYLPSALVEEGLRTAPSRVTVYDRQGRPAMFLEDRNTYYGTGSDCPNLLDSRSGRRRPFAEEDVKEAVILVDALPNIDFVMSMGHLPMYGQQASYQTEYAHMLRLSHKPQVITAGDRVSLADQTEMAAAAVGGLESLQHKPLFVLYDEPTSPLVHSFEALDKLLFMAEHRLPTNYAPGIMAGGTSPVTIAGAMAQANAEILTGLVIHQLKSSGAPFLHGAGVSPMDMRSMQPTYAAPEAIMGQAGLTQLGRELYHLPTWGFTGCSASKLCDEQAVYEAYSYLLSAGLMGTNLCHDVGYLEFGLTYSFDLLVQCDEMIGQVRRMMSGITVDAEQLAVEVIQRVGPGGHFLGDEHTFTHFMENWTPGLTDRNTYETWQKQGNASLGQRAGQRLEAILAEHRPVSLTAEADQEIERVLKRARARAG